MLLEKDGCSCPASVDAATDQVVVALSPNAVLHFMCVFPRGATEGLKMVGEYFPWTSGSHFTYTQANHKSVLGIGSYAKAAGAHLHCLKREEVEEWLQLPGSEPPAPTSSAAAAAAAAQACGTCAVTAASAAAALATCPAVIARVCSAGVKDAGEERHYSSTWESDASHPGVSCSAVTDSSEFSSSINSEGIWGEGRLGGGMSEADSPTAAAAGGCGVRYHLVAYPAKDNYEGQLYPMKWIEQVGMRV